VRVYAQLDVFDDRPENQGISEFDESKTIQSQKDEGDINAIVARFIKTGTLPVRPMPLTFADLSEVPSFQEAQNIIIEAERAFMTLPAGARSMFDNNAAEFVEFAMDPANVEKMREWGLAIPAPKVETPPG